MQGSFDDCQVDLVLELPERKAPCSSLPPHGVAEIETRPDHQGVRMPLSVLSSRKDGGPVPTPQLWARKVIGHERGQ